MFKTIIIFSISKLYVYYCCLSLMNETHNEVPQESNESYVDAPLKNIVPNFALNWSDYGNFHRNISRYGHQG